jgi:hypothetical protein
MFHHRCFALNFFESHFLKIIKIVSFLINFMINFLSESFPRGLQEDPYTLFSQEVCKRILYSQEVCKRILYSQEDPVFPRGSG